MSDMKSILKSLEMVVEHSESDLREAAKKESYSPDEIETIKDIAKIVYYHKVLKAMEDAEDEGYSLHYPTWHDGNSYARGYRKRDSMGRYSRRGGYSMDDARDIVMDKLEEAMHTAGSERERMAIEQYINRMGM